MAAIHEIPLDRYGSAPAQGAIALGLETPARHDRTYRFPSQNWEVEIRARSEQVVARTDQPLIGSQLLDAGIDAANQALDLSSIEGRDHLSITSPANNNITFRRENGKSILRYASLMDYPIEVTATITNLRADGTPEPTLTPITPTWMPAFRFHRLSQSSSDLFDAYRNMYLGLEAILDHLFSKSRNEGEKAWLLRAIGECGARINIGRLCTPGASDQVRDIVDRIYDVRVHLFHAKTGQTLIPDERISYTRVAEVYPLLVSLWTEIARAWLSAGSSGGLMTHQGFRIGVESAFAGMRMAVSEDATPPNSNDKDASPLGMPVEFFQDLITVHESKPGRMSLEGRSEVSRLPANQKVGRVLIISPDNVPLVAGNIPGALSLTGADTFEASMTFRLLNRGVPVTEFV